MEDFKHIAVKVMTLFWPLAIQPSTFAMCHAEGRLTTHARLSRR
jgi:hypothetical protein